MLKRLLMTAPVGLAMTLGLFFVMQLLIRSGEDAVSTPRKGAELGFVRVKERPPEIIETLPPPIPEPVRPPPIRTNTLDSGETGPISYPVPDPPTDPGTGDPGFGLGINDGPLVAIVRVEPQYPARLAARGIQGYATVRFDVDENGQVVNIEVIEVSHSGFARPAVQAAERFKFRPRVVDGVAVATRGVVNRFRFELEGA